MRLRACSWVRTLPSATFPFAPVDRFQNIQFSGEALESFDVYEVGRWLSVLRDEHRITRFGEIGNDLCRFAPQARDKFGLH
jgi:hypothetical protein